MSLFKKIFALCLVPYAFWLVFAYDYHFIDNLNLLLHEGGHFFFKFFGEWMQFLGGTILQLFVPMAFALVFLYYRQKYESAFCGIWFGESMMYMAGYMKDAQDQLLPLVTSVNPLTQLIQQSKGDNDTDGGSDKPSWSVWRQDDNGNVALVKAGLTRTEALQLIAEYEAKGHKQTYRAQESQ
jgi:hypothetical protein